jgi:DNA modification methylase
MQKVENIDETPAFAKHVLPAVPSSEVYLEDCVTALKRYADNHFDLAIVDPPYGLAKMGEKELGIAIKTNSYLREQNIKQKDGIAIRLMLNTLMSLIEYQKIKSFGEQIIF